MNKELLVVLSAGAHRDVLEHEFTVTKAASERVFVLSIPDWMSDGDVTSRPGIELATTGPVAFESLDLTDVEAYFVAAWTKNRVSARRTRRQLF